MLYFVVDKIIYERKYFLPQVIFSKKLEFYCFTLFVNK